MIREGEETVEAVVSAIVGSQRAAPPWRIWRSETLGFDECRRTGEGFQTAVHASSSGRC